MNQNGFEPFYHFEGPCVIDVRNDYIKYFKSCYSTNTSSWVYKEHNVNKNKSTEEGAWYRVNRVNCITHPNGFYNEVSTLSIHNQIFKDIICECVPDDKTYGSWKGYYTFKSTILQNIHKKVLIAMDNAYNTLYAYDVLKRKFIQYINHWLYKPGGIRMRKVANTTLVGKREDVNM